MLILGCGNADRADDAAGLLVVRRLRQLGIDAREHQGDALGLVEAFCSAREVIVIDTVVSGAACGEVLSWDAGNGPVPACQFRWSTHDLGVAEAVELSRALGRLPAKLTIYGIEGGQFSRGLAPSREVREAAERLACQLAEQIPRRS